MRPIVRPCWLLIALLAGCASPVPQPVTPEPVAVATPFVGPPEPAPEIVGPDPAARAPSIVAALPMLPKALPPVFEPMIEADLEALPEPASDLWERIVKGYAVAEIEGPLVDKWEQWYSTRPDYVARMIERSRRYLYHVVSEVQARGMPLDVALLPMVESAFNPVALSTSSASGIWQFIPSTGRHYGLTQNFWFDSRRDVIAATDKALDYLQKLYGDFGDWQLALAAYNYGEGNVARAIARNQKRGLPTDYASLSLPDETRNYLPKLQAVKNIVRDPAKYGLVIADVPDAPYFTVVKTDRTIDVKRAAELAEMPVEEFVALNPQHNRPVIAGADEHTILLPIDRAEIFAAKLSLTRQPLVSWQAYRVRPNESAMQIAARFGMSMETLRAVNGLGPRARIHPGHVLLVPAERPSEDAAASLTSAVFTKVPEGRTFYYRVSRGDTLTNIAARYGVTVDELRQWNGLAQGNVRLGQQLRVTSDVVVPVKASRGTARATATGGARSVVSRGATSTKAGAKSAKAAKEPSKAATRGSGRRATAAQKSEDKSPAAPATARRNGRAGATASTSSSSSPTATAARARPGASRER